MKILSANYYKTIFTCCMLLVGCAYCLAASASENKPNVLIFLIDDLRVDLGTYDSEHVISPNIDKLASQGIRFDQAYAQQAICGPSRVSLLTGLRPETLGLYTIDKKGQLRANHPDVVSMPQLFKENGYKTISIGKVYHASIDDQDSWTTQIKKLPNFYSVPENEKTRFAYEAGDVEDEFYKDGKVARDAIETLKNIKDDKFLMVVGFSKPHLPFNAPKKYWDLYDRDKFSVPSRETPDNMYRLALTKWNELRSYGGIPKEGYTDDELTKTLIHAYYASVSYVDAQLGMVMQALEDLKLRENTMVVLMSDHGYKLGEYGAWNKHTNMQLDTRVPLIISRETSHTASKRGLASKALVENIDVFPSIIEATGLPTPYLDGKSLLPLLDNPKLEWDEAAYSLFARGKKYMGVTVTDGSWRYTEWRNGETQELFFKELYSHEKSEVAYANAAGNPKYEKIESKLKILLDQKFPPGAPSFHQPRELGNNMTTALP